MNHLSAFFPDPKGARLHYQYWEESSKGYDRVILVLHGIGCHSGSYSGLLAPALQARYKLVTLDFAGFGTSPGERGAGGVVAMADAIEALFRRLESVEGGREIEIVAHSMGSIAALLFLKRYPARRVRMASIAPLFYGTPVDASSEILAADAETRKKIEADPLFPSSIPNTLASEVDKTAKEILADPSFLEGRKAAFFVGEDDSLVPFEKLKATAAALPLKASSFFSYPRERHELIGSGRGASVASAILGWLDETKFEYRP